MILFLSSNTVIDGDLVLFPTPERSGSVKKQ